MTDEQVEAVAFAIWRVFSRTVTKRSREEADENAWRRRWNYRVKETIREQFRAEAIAAIETFTNGEWMKRPRVETSTEQTDDV
jgi:hypothetical protein